MKVPFAVRRTALSLAYRLGGWPRRVAAGICLLLAVASLIAGHGSAAAPATIPVATATRDLAAGRTLHAGDVRMRAWPATLAPPTALKSSGQAVGHALGAAVSAGEPITSTRLQGRGIAVGLPKGTVASTVTVQDAASLTLVQPGDTIDLVAGATADAIVPLPAHVVASTVRVLAVLPASAARPVGSVVVAVDQHTALALAAATGQPLTVTVRGPR